jgi:hypothetical protein
MPENRYVLGVDLGQAHDPTAVVILEHPIGPSHPTYSIRALHRYPLGTSYTSIVNDLTARLTRPPLTRGHTLTAIDATGVGAPVTELFKQNRRVRDIYGITITGGTTVGGNGYQPTVPKRDLINTTAVILQQRRIRIAAALTETPTLLDELQGYRYKTTDSGHQTYAPANSQDHDDLVLALSLALWLAERKHIGYTRIYRPEGHIPTAEDRFPPFLP